jgi:3'-phosphoadenosine 5'-phosphosulfate sulfotransferase (PAPS reductase)/FAD synthetase
MTRDLCALSLGAGVQSTALLLLGAEGLITKPDFAVFADTGWEPPAVYEHLDRLEREVAQPAGIDIARVHSTGGTGQGIRADAVSPNTRFFRIPVFMRFTEEAENYDPRARPMILRRSCTQTYKLEPIHREYRRRLGATITSTGRVLSAPKDGTKVIQQIGISTDEFQRARDSRVDYIVNTYPLLDLNWSRDDCMEYLTDRGWGSTQKSACIGCPFHSAAEWRRLRDEDPESWQDAVELDRAIRNGPPKERVDGTRWPANFYLHSSGVPLEEARIDPRPKDEQASIFEFIEDSGEGFSCSPHGCQSETAEWRDKLIAAGAVDAASLGLEAEGDEE